VTVKIAISSYSFHGYGGGPNGSDTPSVYQMVDHCVAYGVDGIEFMNQDLTASGVTTRADLANLQQYCAIRGIRPITLAASNNPLRTTAKERADDLVQLIDHIDWAIQLGVPFVRVLGGRWNTITDFAALTANRGEEPPVDGFTDEQGFEWTVTSLRYAAEYASHHGVTLVLENHWGPTGTSAGAKKIHDAVDSPWLKYVLDTGNFFHLEDQYAEMETFLDDLAILHGKTYLGGSRYGVPDIDYARVAGMLKKIDYHGYVSIEFEGFADPKDGIPHGIETIRTHFIGS
jgi:L-ribulose-5-phosphate 3-epimerase